MVKVDRILIIVDRHDVVIEILDAFFVPLLELVAERGCKVKSPFNTGQKAFS